MRIFWFHLLFSIEIYQLFLLFFEILIRWRNIVLEFGIQVIFIRWRFIGESKKFMASSRFQRYFLPYLGTRRGLVPILYRQQIVRRKELESVIHTYQCREVGTLYGSFLQNLEIGQKFKKLKSFYGCNIQVSVHLSL